MKFLRYVFASAVFWLVFTAGYLCRNVLGDWLFDAHTGSVGSQIILVSSGLFRVFLTFVLVAVVGLACSAIVFGTWAVLQELWYQFFERKIISLLARAKQRREEELMAAAEDEGEGAPKNSVRALDHARKGPGVRSNDAPVRPLSDRLQKLRRRAKKAAADEAAAEAAEDTEIKVTIRET